MKKLVLSVIVLASLLLNTSCKSDDDGGNPLASANQVILTIDGQPVVFDTVFIDRDIYMEDDVQVTDIEVDAMVGLDFTRSLYFGLRVGETGTDVLDYFYYDVGDVEYSSFGSDFTATVTVNDGSRLTMSFSGTLNGFSDDGEVTTTITNGLIDAIY